MFLDRTTYKLMLCLVIARILELNTKHKYSIRKLLTLGKIKKILGNTKKGVVTL